MNLRPWVVAASAVGVAVALVWLTRPSPLNVVPEGAAQPAPSLDAAAAESAVVTTSPTERDAAETVAAQTADTPSVASAPPEPARSPLPGETATPMAALLEGAKHDFPAAMAENERRFAAEPVDVDWAPRAEAEILGKFAQQTGLRLLDLRLHCRSTMCRLQLTLPKDALGAGTVPNALETMDLQAKWIVFLNDASGGLSTVAYLPREPISAPDLTLSVRTAQ